MSHEDLIKQLRDEAEDAEMIDRLRPARMLTRAADALAECDRELLAAAATADNCEVLRAEVARLTAERDTLRAELAALREQPVAWVRWRSDGGYEGPLMDQHIDDVRRKSGAWTPLYAAPVPATVPAGWKLVLADAPQPEGAASCAQRPLTRCAAGKDGDCIDHRCPQLRDGEPHATGRHCPLDVEDDPQWSAA